MTDFLATVRIRPPNRENCQTSLRRCHFLGSTRGSPRCLAFESALARAYHEAVPRRCDACIEAERDARDEP